MEQNGLLIPTRLLTGYVPGADALREVSKLAKKLRSRFPNLIYLLDPVMGDEGEMYVSEDVIPIYRELLPLSTIITPNYFEVEVLTKISLDSLSSLREALRILHEEYKVPNVVISSIPLSGALLSARPHWFQDMQQRNFLLCIASAASKTGISVVHTMFIPQLKGYFVGVGDFFSAMVLGHFRETVNGEPPTLAHAVASACRITYALLLRTNYHVLTYPEVGGDGLDASDIERRVRQMRGRELRIVQERELIIKHDITEHLLGGDMEEWNNFWES
ncbi:hypothetical protein Clacol_005655 [Clathrus columnatus]|uniref:pyridoxal kinase n=1 Tax=Clathrus columnatus TaxID=1419009 RepID=A0AAV5ACK8_9AGAM|nr:hypothetical protein Clacol_005655 [Clathrus columnatus]